MKLRINLNSQAIVKLAGLVSNSIILSTNVFLLGTNFKRQISQKKIETIANKLQLTAEVAQAVATLSKVIVATLEGYERRIPQLMMENLACTRFRVFSFLI